MCWHLKIDKDVIAVKNDVIFSFANYWINSLPEATFWQVKNTYAESYVI